MNFGKFQTVLKQTFEEWRNDHIPREAGALSFFTIFSLAPMLVIAITVGSLVMNRNQLRSQLLDWVSQNINPQAATVLQDMLESAANTGGGVATIISIVFLLIAGTTLFYHLRKVMNKIWNIEDADIGIMGRLRSRIVALLFVVLIGVLLVILVGLNSVLPSFIGNRYTDINWARPVAQLVSGIVSFIIFAFIFAVAFRWLPAADVEWSDVTVGAALTALLFMVGQFFVQYYIRSSSTASAYGAAGAIVVLLIWVFYTMFVLLTGAEFTHVYARKYGSQRGDEYLTEDDARIGATT